MKTCVVFTQHCFNLLKANVPLIQNLNFSKILILANKKTKKNETMCKNCRNIVIKYANFQLYRTYLAGIIWRNRLLVTNIWKYTSLTFETSNDIDLQNNVSKTQSPLVL